jgi:GTP-dependent dephospho-CoA kinase
VAASPSASSEGPPFRDLLLRPQQRSLLARPLGPVLTTDQARRELSSERGQRIIASCGDVVTANLLQWGFRPFLAVVDGKTLRDRTYPLKEFESLTGNGRRSARNPAGQVTADLQEKIRDMARGSGGLLVVEGEEDLAVLPMVRELPLGATLLYGQPGEGVCFLTLDAKIKERVTEILNGMELRPS